MELSASTYLGRSGPLRLQYPRLSVFWHIWWNIFNFHCIPICLCLCFLFKKIALFDMIRDKNILFCLFIKKMHFALCKKCTLSLWLRKYIVSPFSKNKMHSALLRFCSQFAHCSVILTQMTHLFQKLPGWLWYYPHHDQSHQLF